MLYQLKTPLTATAATAALATSAFAGPTYENASGGSFTYYGQFDPAIVSFDDGITSNDEIVDNASSNSRVGFIIRHPFGENELRFHFETSLGLRASDDVTVNSTPKAIDWSRTSLRRVDFQYETANHGTFYFGQGSMASDGIGDRSLSGTGLASSVAIGDVAGGYHLRDAMGNFGPEVGDVFVNLDGSRRGRIRYDTPSFNGFTLSVAYGQDILTSGNTDDFYDIGLGYEAEISGGIGIEAGLGYQVRERDGAPDREDTFGSFAVLLPSGWNFSVALGDRNTGGEYYFLQAGYRMDFFALGETAFSIDYYDGSDFDQLGGEAESIGLAVVQDIDKLNIEAYLGYREYEYSTPTTNYLDAQSVIFGARVRF